jgi:hypothetical protein
MKKKEGTAITKKQKRRKKEKKTEEKHPLMPIAFFFSQPQIATILPLCCH